MLYFRKYTTGKAANDFSMVVRSFLHFPQLFSDGAAVRISIKRKAREDFKNNEKSPLTKGGCIGTFSQLHYSLISPSLQIFGSLLSAEASPESFSAPPPQVLSSLVHQQLILANIDFFESVVAIFSSMPPSFYWFLFLFA